MSGGGLVEVLRGHLPKDRYGYHGEHLGTVCTCGGWAGDYVADGEAGPFDLHLADVVTAHLAARLEGCRADGTFADRLFWWNRGDDPYFVIHGRAGEVAEGDPYQPIADAALAIVRDALGLEPPSDALGGASDGRTGRDGASMQGERAGDGL